MLTSDMQAKVVDPEGGKEHEHRAELGKWGGCYVHRQQPKQSRYANAIGQFVPL